MNRGELMVTNRLKEIRKDKSLSLEEVGKGVGLATNTISRYETGKREPKLETWLKLAEFFNVSVSYLQGLTISENDVLKIMNEAYLSDVEEFLTLQNKSQKFDYVSFIKTNNNFNISHSIDMYLLINKIPLPLNAFSMIQLKNYSKEVEAYWNKNFNFIFDDIVEIDITRYPSFNLIKDIKLKAAERNSLISDIRFCISCKYLEVYTTSISKYYDNQDYYHDIAMFQSNSDEIMRFNSKSKIKKQVTKIIKELSDFSTKLDKLPDNPQFDIDKLVKLNSTIKSH